MNTAHVFQHDTTGVQIFVYHAKDEDNARIKFRNIVSNDTNWLYLGQKVATNI